MVVNKNIPVERRRANRESSRHDADDYYENHFGPPEEHEYLEAHPSTLSKRGIIMPVQITFQEILTISGVILSLALAWGGFQTKVSLLEQINQTQDEKIKMLQQDLKETDTKLDALRDEIHQAFSARRDRSPSGAFK